MVRPLAPSPRRAGALALLAFAWPRAADALRRAAAAPGVVLVQGTNRPVPRLESLLYEHLEGLDSPHGVITDWLGAAQIAAYAEQHGYAHRVYVYNDTYKGACWHPERGPLLAQWCKIAALRLAYEEFPKAQLFAWLDTDVTIRQVGRSLEDYLARAPLIGFRNETDPKDCVVEEPARGRGSVSVFSSRNAHWLHWEGKCGPNSGIMFFRRSEFTSRLLEGWWDSAMKPGVPGPYDQGFVMLQYAAHPQDIAVFREDAMNDGDVFALHRCQKCKWLPNRTNLFLTYHPVKLDLAGVNGALQRLQDSVDTTIRDRTLRRECSGCPRKG